MRLVASGDQRWFYYETPKAELREAGVNSGTLLFEGRKQGNYYVGKARRFSKYCPETPLEYAVEGPVSPDQLKVTVRGSRPVYSKCSPTSRYTDDTLVFTYLRDCSSPVKNQTSVDRFEQQVAMQLLASGLVLTSQGYELSHDVYVRKLYRGDTYNLDLNLKADTSYAIAAVCDEDCSDIDIYLFDENRHLVAKDVARDDFPYVSITPKWSSWFTIGVVIPACAARRCTFGVGVFSR